MAGTGTAIKHYRDRLKIRQIDLAEILGVDEAVMSRIEAGIQIPTAEQVDRIAGALHVVPSLLWSQHLLAEVAERSRATA